MNRLYIGNIPYKLSEAELRRLCELYGEVTSVAIPADRESGRPKGFAFVEFASDKEARAARDALDTTTVGGREIKVDFAKPRESQQRKAG